VSSAIGSANGVNLNKADAEQLEKVGGLGRERAERIVRQRPFEKWDDLKRIEGFSDNLVNDLKNSGATL
jgi:DNA uptake protein ComE-like DNA-binding protein